MTTKSKKLSEKSQQSKEIKIKNKPQIVAIKNKKQYVAVFLLQENNSYSWVGRKRFDPSETEISFKKGVYPIISETPSFTKGLKEFYFFDVKKGNQMYIGLNSKVPVMTPKMLDKIIKRNIITQLTQNLMGSKIGFPLMIFLGGCVMGGAIGWIVGNNM